MVSMFKRLMAWIGSWSERRAERYALREAQALLRQAKQKRT